MQDFTLILVTSVTVLVGCTGGQPNLSDASSQPQHLIMSEGSSTSDGLSISNGNVVVKENQPGVAFATVTLPGQSKRIAYFLVFNHDRPNAGVTSEGGSRGATASTSHTINTYGNESTAKYELVLKSGADSIETETISIDDEAFGSSKGRVFLIDMKLDPPGVSQFHLDLPTEVPELKETEATEQFSHDALTAMRKADQAVDAFCRAIEATGN
ncbi:hypothetical protein [Stieleria neptunia]|uniref:hypothetical protein n=1 Tax=Stieleria neptunia TaxID=2527979 RepID=UPI00119EFAC9|nr:hypothetical protein [Stieleria neptunia]